MGSRIQFLTRLWFLTSAVFFITGCSTRDCFHGEGEQYREIRTTGEFDRIYLTDDIDLIVHPSGLGGVVVTAGENLIENIETSVDKGTLTLRNNNHCNWVRNLDPKITVEVNATELREIFVEDAIGNISFSDTLHTTEFRLDSYSSMGEYSLKLDCNSSTFALHTGPADLTVTGKSPLQTHYNAGYGVSDCSGLISNAVYITNKGSNDAKVYVKDYMEAEIKFSGNIYYKSDSATIKSKVTGTGKLIKF